MMVTIYIDDLKEQGWREWEMEVHIIWVTFKAIRLAKIKIERDHNDNYDDNGDYYDWYWWWWQRWYHILLHKEGIIFQLARSEPIKTIPWPVLAATTAQNRPQLPSRGVRVSNNACVTKGVNIDAGLMVSVDVSRFGVGHDDVNKWKHFPRNWPFVRGINRSQWIVNPRPKHREYISRSDWFTENKISSIWKLCCHWWYGKLSLRQFTAPSVTAKLSNFQSFVFSEPVRKWNVVAGHIRTEIHSDHQKLGPYVSKLIPANTIHFAVSEAKISLKTKNIPMNWPAVYHSI